VGGGRGGVKAQGYNGLGGTGAAWMAARHVAVDFASSPLLREQHCCLQRKKGQPDAWGSPPPPPTTSHQPTPPPPSFDPNPLMCSPPPLCNLPEATIARPSSPTHASTFDMMSKIALVFAPCCRWLADHSSTMQTSFPVCTTASYPAHQPQNTSHKHNQSPPHPTTTYISPPPHLHSQPLPPRCARHQTQHHPPSSSALQKPSLTAPGSTAPSHQP